MSNVMEDLYRSEINCGAECFYDTGWNVWLGDNLNGYREQFDCSTWSEVEEWLTKKAMENYPDSEFARSRR